MSLKLADMKIKRVILNKVKDFKKNIGIRGKKWKITTEKYGEYTK